MDECLIRISEVEERMTDKLIKSHQGISESVSGFGKDLKTLAGRLAEHTEHEEHYQRKVETHMEQTAHVLENLATLTTDDVKSLKDVAQGVSGIGAVKKMIIGLASIVIAVGAIVGGFIGIIKMIR